MPLIIDTGITIFRHAFMAAYYFAFYALLRAYVAVT